MSEKEQKKQKLPVLVHEREREREREGGEGGRKAHGFSSLSLEGLVNRQ